jgi:hypothetical protein
MAGQTGGETRVTGWQMIRPSSERTGSGCRAPVRPLPVRLWYGLP